MKYEEYPLTKSVEEALNHSLFTKSQIKYIGYLKPEDQDKYIKNLLDTTFAETKEFVKSISDKYTENKLLNYILYKGKLVDVDLFCKNFSKNLQQVYNMCDVIFDQNSTINRANTRTLDDMLGKMKLARNALVYILDTINEKA